MMLSIVVIIICGKSYSVCVCFKLLNLAWAYMDDDGMAILITDCFWRTQTQSVWGIVGWSSRGWGPLLQEDSFESWGCSRKECFDKLLGMMVLSFFFVRPYWLRWFQFNLGLYLFREWISLLTSWGLWSENGKLWLKLM